MIRSFSVLFLAFLLQQNLHAQHCPFDGSAIVVVNVQGSDSSTFSPEYILLSVRDVRGNIIYSGGRALLFVKNPRRTWPQRGIFEHDKIAYQFAGDNFILHFPDQLLREYEHKGGLYIYANPTSGNYLPAIHPLKEKDVYNIHYVNNYLSSGSNSTDPVPQNEKNPFHHLVTLIVPATK